MPRRSSSDSMRGFNRLGSLSKRIRLEKRTTRARYAGRVPPTNASGPASTVARADNRGVVIRPDAASDWQRGSSSTRLSVSDKERDVQLACSTQSSAALSRRGTGRLISS
jgi:hypothetical protein